RPPRSHAWRRCSPQWRSASVRSNHLDSLFHVPVIQSAHPEESSMASVHQTRSSGKRSTSIPAAALSLAVALSAAACSHATVSSGNVGPAGMGSAAVDPSKPDPRVGLKPGLWDAGQAAWNLKLVSATKPSEKFIGSTNSDIAFRGSYVIQGNYNGYQIWDISNPSSPMLKVGNYCPASQSDVSI